MRDDISGGTYLALLYEDTSFTNTYQKRKHSKKPQIVTYVDGPFYPDAKLRGKEQKADLRNRVYEQMKERSSRNTLVLATYIKKGDV